MGAKYGRLYRQLHRICQHLQTGVLEKCLRFFGLILSIMNKCGGHAQEKPVAMLVNCRNGSG
jgi:hypothetical protein